LFKPLWGMLHDKKLPSRSCGVCRFRSTDLRIAQNGYFMCQRQSVHMIIVLQILLIKYMFIQCVFITDPYMQYL
jgi:hypothetical protein